MGARARERKKEKKREMKREREWEEDGERDGEGGREEREQGMEGEGEKRERKESQRISHVRYAKVISRVNESCIGNPVTRYCCASRQIKRMNASRHICTSHVIFMKRTRRANRFMGACVCSMSRKHMKTYESLEYMKTYESLKHMKHSRQTYA